MLRIIKKIRINLFIIIISSFISILLSSCSGDDNHAPQLLNLYDQNVFVNSLISFTVSARDADNDKLEFDFTAPEIPDIKDSGRALLVKFTSNEAKFRWVPQAKDSGIEGRKSYNFTFTVKDGNGGKAQETIIINVVDEAGGNTSPVFIQPAGAGITIDLAQEKCIDNMNIIVKDDNSSPADVRLDMEPPLIEGAKLDPSYNMKEKRFTWCPSESQVNQGVQHTLTLVAQDENNPPVIRRFLFRLKPAKKTDTNSECPGTPPEVIHSMPQTSLQTWQDYFIDIEVSDDNGLKEVPILNYSVYDSNFSGNTSTLHSDLTPFIRINSTNKYRASIPNLNLQLGEKRYIYYSITAVDNDDADGTGCDHETTTSNYNIEVSSPSSGLDVCSPCQFNNQCGSNEDYCISIGESRGVCGESCNGGSCENGFSCSSSNSTSGESVQQCMPISSECISANFCQTCTTDSQCDMRNGKCVLEGNTQGYCSMICTKKLRCPNDFICMPAGYCAPVSTKCGEVEVECNPDSYEANNSVESASIVSEGTYNNLSICSDDYDWFKIPVSEGKAVLYWIEFDGSKGDLDMEVVLPGDIRLFSQETDSNDETVDKNCISTSGDAFIKIYGYDGAVNDYSLSIAHSEGDCQSIEQCVDDWAEVNDEHTQATALSSSNGTWPDMVLCPENTDWYLVYLERDEKIEVSIAFKQEDGDLDLEFYKSNDIQNLIMESLSVTDNENIEFVSAESGSYLIKVIGYELVNAVNYSLNFNVSSVSSSCSDDKDCVAGRICGNGVCVSEACSPSNNCPQGYRCEPHIESFSGSNEGYCVSGCTSNNDCRTDKGYECKMFYGQKACARAGNSVLGERCSSFIDCYDDYACYQFTSGYCTTTWCSNSTQCPLSSWCIAHDLAQICLGSCENDSDCRQEDGFACQDRQSVNGYNVKVCIGSLSI